MLGRDREPVNRDLPQYGRQPAPTAIARAANEASAYAILRSRIVSLLLWSNLRQQGFQRASTETYEVIVRISSTSLSIGVEDDRRRGVGSSGYGPVFPSAGHPRPSAGIAPRAG